MEGLPLPRGCEQAHLVECGDGFHCDGYQVQTVAGSAAVRRRFDVFCEARRVHESCRRISEEAIAAAAGHVHVVEEMPVSKPMGADVNHRAEGGVLGT